MAAWYIARVNSFFCKVLYFLVQDRRPFEIEHPLDHSHRLPGLRRGPGYLLVRGLRQVHLPEIEEAAAIDGCGPLRTYFSVVLPMLRPTMISVGILEIMWVWNDYCLPFAWTEDLLLQPFKGERQEINS